MLLLIALDYLGSRRSSPTVAARTIVVLLVVRAVPLANAVAFDGSGPPSSCGSWFRSAPTCRWAAQRAS